MARVVFMGTPEFAVPSLRALADNYETAAVYTRADKPAGRGRKLVESPVKRFARERGLPIEQPRTLRDEKVQKQLLAYRPDLIVVAAYGLILPQQVLDIPGSGSLNVHASLLPRWRGAAPIPHAILAGDTRTGVTLMKMDVGLDTGPIITCQEIQIAPDETAGTLSEKLSHLGASLLLQTLPGWLAAQIELTAQPQTGITVAPKIEKESGLIDWGLPAVHIERMVRAYNPSPGAFTFLGASRVKILRAGVLQTRVSEAPGTVMPIDGSVGVATGEGLLLLHQVQLEGKRPMAISEFLHGHLELLRSRLGRIKSPDSEVPAS